MKCVVGIGLWLLLTGCASQQEVDDLKKQISELKHQREEQHQALVDALSSAETAKLGCRARAEGEYDDALAANGTPDPKHKGFYTGNREVFKNMKDEQAHADAECQKDYEDAVQAAKIQYGN
jgi:outer membrane murein-binding lipoprotein Lpp